MDHEVSNRNDHEDEEPEGPRVELLPMGVMIERQDCKDDEIDSRHVPAPSRRNTQTCPSFHG